MAASLATGLAGMSGTRLPPNPSRSARGLIRARRKPDVITTIPADDDELELERFTREAQYKSEIEHRREQEFTALNARIAERRRAQWMAFAFVIACLGVAETAIIQGAEWVGGVIGTGGIVSVVTAFLSTLKSPTEDVRISGLSLSGRAVQASETLHNRGVGEPDKKPPANNRQK